MLGVANGVHATLLGQVGSAGSSARRLAAARGTDLAATPCDVFPSARRAVFSCVPARRTPRVDEDAEDRLA